VEVAAWGKAGPKKKAKRRRKKTRGKKARRKKARRHSELPPASASHRRLHPLLEKGSSLPDVLPPYSLKRVFRGFGKCRRGKHTHQALDLGGVGENAGLGTPIFAMARSKVTLIGLPEEDAKQFGKPHRGKGTVRRGYNGHLVLPKQERIPGYGWVTYFTRDYGSWRSGTVISTRVVDGPMKGHAIRYMHLGAVHPTLKRGIVVEAGEEIGLMGGTAILDSAPHVHVDMTDPNGERVDIARLLGLPQAAKPCPPVVESTKRVRRRKSKARKPR
jgi:murein DD-endopeptidase MepM/ murein hydrolase activator NlpD